MHTRQKIWVGLSGGVDSSVAAALLVEQGYGVEGVYLKCWEDDGSLALSGVEECPWEQDQADAKAVADALGIPFRSINLVSQYKERVFSYMVEEYAAGRTPNPDVVCNREIKFGLFLEEALRSGVDAVATGHYVRRHQGKLLAGVDVEKDQSYFLWQLRPEMVQHALFPLGEMEKHAVREEARRRGFTTAEKPDSTGVCFIGEVPMQEFLSRFINEEPGPVLTSAGKQVGEHKGLSFYTIGQRRGIGIFGGGPPYYVAEKDASRNALIVAAPAEQGTALYRSELVAHSLNWISGSASQLPLCVEARIRYRQPLQAATLLKLDSNRVSVVFDEPQKAVTPGQSVVFYQEAVLLGGGVIA